MKKKLLFMGAILSCTQINAQEAIASSGENVSGSSGTISYSVGQIVYTTATGTNGSLSQGVEQPIEIQTLSGADNFNVSLELSIYPNPTTDLLYLQVKESNFENVQYQLFDFNGRLLENKRVTTASTTIQMEKYPGAIYLLKVLDNNKEVKTFKIIKR
ncbi:hypothetical protein FLJC2902T_22150 [Flavobacterium limnosediminis JC2902]|uniref:Secretion system C-terminal sorting domain-containing protein n=1 Tax=Flavobacterium limnosediminis JC2902 TaxID=1341181 RepID=V6SLH0_9FLAO|nr:T9SS type A sorting domain-containing protein [Flavobacterium limnosediminis]ESU27107.1 hypothetical protein FLJC2902T_22150 [Flavobacterium limnosediminis JC2902]